MDTSYFCWPVGHTSSETPPLEYSVSPSLETCSIMKYPLFLFMSLHITDNVTAAFVFRGILMVSSVG